MNSEVHDINLSGGDEGDTTRFLRLHRDMEHRGNDGRSDRELLLEIAGDVKRLIEVRQDHENRIRKMEQEGWKQSGAFGVIGIVVSAAIAWLISFFKDGKHSP